MLVLLPGWIGTRWSLIPLQRALRERLQCDVLCPDVGLGLGCIRRSAERAAREIAARAPRRRVDVIGHSMGGLVATCLLKQIDGGRRVRTVVTLGTPHRGSPHLHTTGSRLVSRISRSIEQMTPDCAFLRELSAGPVPPHSRIVSIAAREDVLVPPLYTRLPRRPRQYNRDVHGSSHLGLIFSARVLDAIVGALRPPLRLVDRKSVPVVTAPATLHVLDAASGSSNEA